MIDKEMLDRFGQLWKRLRDPAFASDPLGLMRDARGLVQELPAYQAKMVQAGAMLAGGPADQNFRSLPEDVRQVKRFFSGLLWAMRRVGFQDPEQIALCKAGIGLAHNALGKYERATRYLTPALEVMRKRMPPGHDFYLATEYAWATTEIALGRSLAAMPAIEQAVLRARDAGCNSEFRRKLESLISTVYGQVGQRDRSRRMAEQGLADCLRRFGRESRETVEAMCHLALTIELPEGNIAKATEFLVEGLYLLEVNSGVFWAEASRVHVELLAAEIERLAGHPDAEIHHLAAAEQAGRRFGRERDPTLVEVTLRLAAKLHSIGRHREALDHLEQISKEATAINWLSPSQRAQYLTTYSGCRQALYLPLPLESTYGEFLTSLEEEGRQIQRWAGEDLQVDNVQKIWTMIGLHLTMLLTRPSSLKIEEISDIFRQVLEFKGTVAESLCISREHRFSTLYPECRAELEHLGEMRRRLLGTYRDVFKGAPDSEEERTVNILRAEMRKLEASLERRIPELDRKPPSVRELAEDLGDLDNDCVLLEFVHVSGPKGSPLGAFAVFMLPAGRPDLLRLVGLGGADSISEGICQFRDSLLAESDPKRFSGRLPTDYGFLWQRVWAPIEAALEDLRQMSPGRSFRRLFVSLDNTLCWLPFQVLRNPQWPPDHYLIDEYEISYLAAPRDLVNIPNLTARRGSRSLALGLCDFGGDEMLPASPKKPSGTSAMFGALRDAENQAMRVGEQLDAEVWRGKHEATKQRLLDRLGHLDLGVRACDYSSPTILHIASHGFSLAKGPAGGPADLPESGLGAAIREALLRSGLALSGASASVKALLSVEPLKGPMPGILTAYEISGLDLRDTQMAVLSACESGLGTISSGEGVFGLQRAFFIAGANSLVMALWPVREDATALLMEAFYAKLRRGEPRSAALRAAQRQVRLKLRWPASWGGFICQGNPLPISQVVMRNPDAVTG